MALKAIKNEINVEAKLEALMKLQEIDSEIDRIRILRGELPMEVEDLQNEIEGLTNRVYNVEEDLKYFEHEVTRRNTMIKEANGLIEKYEKQTKSVKNNREFEALSKEIELQKLEIQLCEKKIRDAKFQIENKNVALKDAQKALQNKQESLDDKEKELAKITKDTEKEEKALLNESNKAAEKIDERLITAYNKLRKTYKNGLAVVKIVRSACGGCFNQIPSQRKIEVRQRKKVLTCEHCGRILSDVVESIED